MNEWAKMKQEQFDHLNEQFDINRSKLGGDELCELLGETQSRTLTQRRTLSQEGLTTGFLGGARETEIQKEIDRRN